MNGKTGEDSRGDRQSWLGRVLASRTMPLVAVMLALLLTAASIGNGLDADDYYHRSVLTGSTRFSPLLGGPQEMFRFLTGDSQRTRELMDLGFLPWWTYPGAKAEFLQFLTVQTHILDYRLWPDHPEWMHVHSLAWFAVLVLLAAVVYRRLLGASWMAGAAALFFAVEDGHATPVGWICNRNILLAASFGFACLIAHDVWRRDKRAVALPFALLLWTCSLCSKEAGIATSAYLAAYAFWLDEARLTHRLFTLVPYGLVLIAWRIIRDSLGYGVQDLGLYVDPITDTPRFVSAMIERYPVFLLGQWGWPPSDLSALVPRLLGSPLWWAAVVTLSVLGALFWPLLRRDRLARFFATGMLLAIIPICATFATDRLLMFVGFGAMGLLVRFLHIVFAADAPRPRWPLWRLAAVPVAYLLVLLHAVIAPPLLAIRATNPTGPRWYVRRLYIRLPFDAALEHQDLVVVNAPSAMHANYCLLLRDFEGKPGPRSMRVLGPGFQSTMVRRTDENTLEIEPGGGYFGLFLDRLFRSDEHPFHAGQEVVLPRMTARVMSLNQDGRPAAVAFRFDTPLEDPALRWIQWTGDSFVPFEPPAIGERIEIRPRWPSFHELVADDGSSTDRLVTESLGH